MSFFACPSTGEVSWDPPVGNFVYVRFSIFCLSSAFISIRLYTYTNASHPATYAHPSSSLFSFLLFSSCPGRSKFHRFMTDRPSFEPVASSLPPPYPHLSSFLYSLLSTLTSLSLSLRPNLLCSVFHILTHPPPPLSNSLPPSEEGEWWEISDKTRGGLPYYYHTKTGRTVWDKPEGFVIPLTVLQVRFYSLIFFRRILGGFFWGGGSLCLVCWSSCLSVAGRTDSKKVCGAWWSRVSALDVYLYSAERTATFLLLDSARLLARCVAQRAF